MKILYAIQGTGNGHLSRAFEIIPCLQKKGEVDILVSGLHSEIELPYQIKYNFKGLGFIFGTRGGIDLMNTYLKNNIRRFANEINSVPVEKYNLIISDFEPVSAWACYLKNKVCIGLSNQAALFSKNAPCSNNPDPLGKFILKNYCPTTFSYGYHFQKYNETIFTPIIRREIRNSVTNKNGKYIVYLPVYSDKKIINFLSNFPKVQWKIFSKHSKKKYSENNCEIEPISGNSFVKELASCSGVFCNAGFTTPSEALFLQKNLLVIPMRGQYEQQCNSIALKQMGVQTINNLKDKNINKVLNWIENPTEVSVKYEDETQKIINQIVGTYSDAIMPANTMFTPSKKIINIILKLLDETKKNKNLLL